MKWLATAIAIGVGFVTLLTFFFQQTVLGALGVAFRQWAVILTAFALLLGLVNLLLVHLSRIVKRSEPGAGYSVIVIVTAFLVLVIGLLFGSSGDAMAWIFNNIYTPLQSAFFALSAFFLATAAYRAMRARNIETLLMLITALVVFIGQAPLLNVATQAKEWLLNVPSVAGVRGILLGVALGTIATALRLIVGMDRPYSE